MRRPTKLSSSMNAPNSIKVHNIESHLQNDWVSRFLATVNALESFEVVKSLYFLLQILNLSPIEKVTAFSNAAMTSHLVVGSKVITGSGSNASREPVPAQ